MVQALAFLVVLTLALVNGEAVLKLGEFQPLSNGVAGEIHAETDKILVIKNFMYDGKAPDAYFYAGTSGNPSSNGFLLEYPPGSTAPLGAFDGSQGDITFELPGNIKVTDLAWISVWCEDLAIDFGNMYFDQEAIGEAEPNAEGGGEPEGEAEVEGGLD
ncbi:hypothetical protein TCAL_09849 [Tigriopus californicus]|uniref:DM13 domain-containing protein n=1 Tax=Tigriopus californicus TaxID=6832 RepID=A0A553PBE0_TIGCA|nr:protein Skeletor, isoforms B/C-like [Tigriopus californicus]TRY75005.1 hypothetical protein TCAL_09849 [Tigriopus californicus]|eukprot:TCALIF_09849-PA protein Name:"Similar to Skeletor Protein Skeletor, isoforms B/C (Drosophila melanogaster)" AED:0.09 eAED:0.09 QI:0/-1/0/1/-1/1/1/0/158